MAVDGWRIHRKIGMSGGLFTRAVGREIGHELTDEEAAELQRIHDRLFRELLPARRAPPAARRQGDPRRSCASAASRTGSPLPAAAPASTPRSRRSGSRDDMVVVERGDVARAKPEPDLFLECARRLEVEPEDCYVIGDAVWDLLAARRARMLSIGLLSGGYGADELQGAGAFRVYRDAAELQSLAGRARRLRGAQQRDPHRALAARALRRPDPAVRAVAARDQLRGLRAQVADEDPARRVALGRREVPGVRGERDARARPRSATGATEAPNAGGPTARSRARRAPSRPRPGRARRRRCPARRRRGR